LKKFFHFNHHSPLFLLEPQHFIEILFLFNETDFNNPIPATEVFIIFNILKIPCDEYDSIHANYKYSTAAYIHISCRLFSDSIF